jgi:DNA-directed RNA polymerase specialized sigma24 family protein
MASKMDSLNSKLGRILASLPFAQREAILEVDILGESVPEACAKLGVSSKILERRLARGRSRVLAQIGKPL